MLTGTTSHEEASKACSDIHEKLLDLKDTSQSFNLTAILGHLVYNSPVNTAQQYWVSSAPGYCQATNAYGKISDVNCLEQLPALCSQSAPFSNASYADTASEWQVTVQAGERLLTGYVELFCSSRTPYIRIAVTELLSRYRDRASFRFLGVRYADQPERFTYSEVFAGSGTQAALAYGSQCIQLPGEGDEDCLFLNIFTSYLPSTGCSDELRPIMFYIHGGAFVSGTGANPDYDGGNLASRGDVVVVTINYRLGVFGFLALDSSTRGNYGMADQVVALDWIRANIASFGGDPNRITVFGQSAGANSVISLLGSPQAFGKFAAAMPMSHIAGLGILGDFYTVYSSIADAAASAVSSVLEPTNCTSATSQVDCLRDFDAQDLLLLTSSMTP